jgi:hypothetical protein
MNQQVSARKANLGSLAANAQVGALVILCAWQSAQRADAEADGSVALSVGRKRLEAFQDGEQDRSNLPAVDIASPVRTEMLSAARPWQWVLPARPGEAAPA